jgi:hypothetical protein
MKRPVFTSACRWLVAAVVVFSVIKCSRNDTSVYQRIRSNADVIKVINTYEHQHWPEELYSVKTIEMFRLEERLGRKL